MEVVYSFFLTRWNLNLAGLTCISYISLSLFFSHFYCNKWTRKRNATHRATCQCLLSQLCWRFLIKRKSATLISSNLCLNIIILPKVDRIFDFFATSTLQINQRGINEVSHNRKHSSTAFLNIRRTIAAEPANKSVKSQWFGHEL